MSLVNNWVYVLTFALLLLAIFVFFACLVIGGLGLLVPWTLGRMRPEDRPKIGMKTKGVIVFMAFTSGLVAIFLIHSIFFQFHMYGIDKNTMRLMFCWPRSSVVIFRGQFQNWKIEADRDGNAQLILFANGKSYVSVPFDRRIDTNSIRSQIEAWVLDTSH